MIRRLATAATTSDYYSQAKATPTMPTLEIRKQISIFVPISDWKVIRQEAAQRRIPMTELCRQWMHHR